MGASPANVEPEQTKRWVFQGPSQSWWAPQELLSFWNLSRLWSWEAACVPVELEALRDPNKHNYKVRAFTVKGLTK